MKQKLSQLTAPALAGVVKEKGTKAAIAEINNCVYDGADMIDLHLSCLENTEIDELRKIITFSKLPVLALNYNNTYEGKNAGYSEDDRARLRGRRQHRADRCHRRRDPPYRERA